MYDGVQVLMDALGRLWRKKPDAFRNALRRAAGLANSTKVIDCNPGKSWVVPFEHGDKISRLIKKVTIIKVLSVLLQKRLLNPLRRWKSLVI